MNRSRVREAVLDLIGEQMGTFSSEDLIALVRERQMATGESSIYGCIDLFVKIGILLPPPMGLVGSLVWKSLRHDKALLPCQHCGSALLHRSIVTLTELQTVTPPRFSDVTPLLFYWRTCPQCYRLGRRQDYTAVQRSTALWKRWVRVHNRLMERHGSIERSLSY